MRTKSFILTFLMMMFCSVSFGQNTNPDWGEFNYHDYAMNMEVIAKISLDGEAQTSTSIQVAAYCGNERRSEVMMIKQAPVAVGGSLVQLQVFGVKDFPTDPNQTQTTEKITFKFYDGTSMFVSNEDMDFKGNHVVGDLFNPFTIEFKSVAKIGDVKYGSLQAAINAAQANDVIVLLADVVAETNPVSIPANVTLDLNYHTIKADIFGTVRTNNGLWITSDGYKMIGIDADIYASDDATVVNTLVNNINTITIAVGDVTLAATQYNEWWTAQGQELIIGESVTFTIPQGKKFNIESNTSVTINGTVSNEGTLAIKNDATVKGNITGDIHFLGGKYITADNYNMVGTTSDYYYNTTDALVNIAGQFGDITIKSGEMTLGKSWRTVQGQTLTIASGAKFTVPANMTFEVFKNTHVIVNGTLVTDGTVYLQLNATVKAAEGLNVTTNVADHKVVYEGGVYKVVEKVYIAQTETGAKFETLQEAVNAGTTVTLLQPATGAGVVIDKDITIDFGGKTYTVNQAVGSTGTETLGFQILKDNDVTLKNGTLTSTAVTSGKEVKMLIQNYANLTLTNMNLDDATEHIQYVLSNNSGTSNINGATSITTDAVAFDVYDYTAGGYTVPTVNVETTGIIKGAIEVSSTATLNIKDGSFTTAIAEAWCAEGYIPTTEVVGETTYYTVKEGEYVARNTTTGQGYETLVEAVEAAAADQEVKLLANVTLASSLNVNRNVVLDLNGKKISSTVTRAIHVANASLTINDVAENSGMVTTTGNAALLVGENATLVVNGGTIKAQGAIMGNGQYNGTNITINGGKIDGKGEIAIYHPQNGVLNIKGGTIVGSAGVEMRAGTLNMTAGTVEATGTFATRKHNSGQTVDGVAIALSQHTTNHNVDINITGGTITSSANGKAFYQDRLTETYTPSINITADIAATTVEGAVEAAELGYNIVENNGVYSLVYVGFEAQIGEVKYETLVEAVEAAQAGDVVTLLKSATGAGVVINKNITIDFGGNTYTVNQAVGSAGTETLGFQILKDNDVTLKNGTLTSTTPVVAGKEVKMLIQNYADLTLTNMNLVDNTDHILYALSNNSGNVKLDGNTNITTDKVAFDVYDYTAGGYAQPVVNVNTTGTISGKIEVSESISNNLNISGGLFTVEIEEAWCADGYIPTQTEDGKWTVKLGEYVARVNGQGYETFDAALAADGEVIVIKPIVITEDKEYNFTNEKITGDNVYPIFRIQNGATMIVTGGEVTNPTDYVFVLGASDGSSHGDLIINGGKYHGATTVASVTLGALTITGGEFSVEPYEGNYAFLINCIDANYTNGTASVAITGGTFHNWNPQNNAAEGTGTDFCYVDHAATETAENVWTVLPAVAKIGEARFATLQDAVNAAQANETINLIANVQLTKFVTIDKSVNLNLGQFDITRNDGTALYVNGENIQVAIYGTGKVSGYQAVFVNNGIVTINGGNFVGNPEAVYVINNGHAVINGGRFETIDSDKRYVLNEYDATRDVTTINVYGGTFVGFDPENNAAEGAGTNFCADGYLSDDNGDGTYTVREGVYVAQVNDGAKYESLVEAVEAAQAGETVTLLKSATGAGVVINKNITIDFGGFTYSFNEGVGSTGTESNGFQILQGNTVVLKNGGLNVAETAKAKFYILVQNYANLTVKDMNLDGTNLDKWSATDGDSYVLSNNSGTVNITGATNITANNDGDKAFAFDVCKYANYAVPTVNVNTTGTIAGKIEVSSEIPTNLNISGGTFTVEVEEAWCADGFIPKDNGDGTWTVKVGKYVARNTTTGQGYETLRAAVETANAGETITLLQDITLEGGYEDATEGLRIELKGEDYANDKYLTIDGNGKTINCGNYEKGIRIYNENSKLRRLDINNVTIVNNNTNGRCIDTRSGMINLKINNSELTATNGNSQPLTIGGNDEIHRVMLGNTKINAGNSGYGVICFVSTNVDIQTSGNTQIDGYAAFYIKGDDKTVNLNLGQGVYTGKNVHSGESNNFGAVVLEGDNVSVNLYGTNPTVKAIAEGTASQTAFLVLGENNTITIKSETTQVVTEGDNAYWAMIDADIASSTTIRYGKEIANNQYEYTPILPAAEARGFQFMSLEEAIRFANAEETVTIVNDNTMTATVVVEKNLTIDLNNKTVSYSSTAASPAIRVLADVTVKNGTIKTTNDEGNNYCFIVGQGEKAGKLTIESGLYDASLGGTSVASVTNGELNIEGGEFISKEYNGDHRYLINCIDANYNNGTATVAISGGTFHKFNPENNLAEGADTNFCPEGYIAVYDAVNDTYTVKEGVWRAQIADVKYETVIAAVKAAVDGDVIELLGDVTENFTVGYEATDIKKITIDLKQHTLSSSDLTITINRTGTELTLVNGTVTGNSTGGTIRPTGGGKLILGNDVIVKSGGQAKAIYLHNGHFIVEKDKNVKVYGGIGFLDADNNNNNNEPTVNYISIASGYYQGAIEINDESTCILTGGTYTQDVNEWCADGYVSQYNGDGTWTVRVANYVAAIGETKYESLKAAIDAAQDGNTITVIKSHELAETVIINKNVNIDFATGVELTTKAYPTAFRIIEGADVTVVNANIKTVEGGLYNFILGASDSSSEGKLTIKNGTFVANTTVASVTKGNLVIEGGDFSLVEGTTDYRYLINCIDANYNADPRTANVEIYGGTFHNWNPQDNAAETGGHANFCAEGYAAVETSTGVWEVVPMQEMKLYAGWNWFSSYIDINGEAGWENLKTGLGSNAMLVKNQNSMSQYYNTDNIVGWDGTLEETSVKEMYMIRMSADHDLTLTGKLVDPSENPIILHHNGWTWIGYQLNEQLPLVDALVNITPNHGDRIKSHQGFSQYYSNESFKGWWGTLENMTPGYGYMYYNAGENNATLKYSYPADGSKSELRTNITSENNYWVPASSQYAGNMNIVAMFEADGDNYEIAAFVGGEVRGSARPIYVEPLDAYMFFLTIHGNEVAEMTFKVYDLATGEEYNLNDRMNYSDNAIIGSIEDPYIFRGTVGIGETSLNEINVYPNPTTTGREISLERVCDTVEVFNALGVKVAEYANVDTIDALETAGIYVIRITNNGNVQNCRLIVK